MIPIKILCGCGQKYAFDVEPANGLMPYVVACPVCKADGTVAANEIIARALAAPIAPVVRPPPIPQVTPPPAPMPAAPAAVKRGKDGWATEETQINKIGTYVTITPAILAAMLPWGVMDIQIPAMVFFIIVGIGGLIGGILNILGRGPILAGAFVGILIAVGGYAATVWWIHDRTSVYKWQLIIAWAIGSVPGFIVQYVLQQILRKKAA